MLCTQKDGTILDFRKAVKSIHLPSMLQSIAHERRFAGAMDWTVLQHSLTMGRAAKESGWDTLAIQYCYYHDAHEAYVRDVPTPFKKAVGAAWYNMEDEIQAKVFKAFGLKKALDAKREDTDCKELDSAACYFEACRFLPPNSPIQAYLEDDAHLSYAIPWKKAYRSLCGLNMVDEHGEVFQKWIDEFRDVLKLK